MAPLLPPPDWVIPPRTLVVAALPRSGSNLLGELMAATGVLGAPLEVFAVDSISKDFPPRDMSVVDRLGLVRSMGLTANGVAGLKLFPEHFDLLQKQVRLSDWLGQPSWIWLRRRDLVGQAISIIVARQSRAFMSERAPTAVPVYAGETILAELQRLAQRDARWQAYFARTGIVPVRIDYEDLERDPEAAITAIARHAGIELPAGAYRPATRFQRQRTELNEDWRRRFLADYGDANRLDWPLPTPPRPTLRARLRHRLKRLLGR